MDFRAHVAVGLVAILVAASLMAGCGGDSDSSESSTTGADRTTEATSTTSEDSSSGQSNAPASEGSNAEPSKEFLGSGANGTLAKIGEESNAAEREAASRVLEEFFQAREEADWKTQCSLLAASISEQIEKAVSLSGGVGCPKALEAQAKGVPAAARADLMSGPIDALRINQGINGFAFFHGSDGNDHVIPLIKQQGWKVVTLTTEEIG